MSAVRPLLAVAVDVVPEVAAATDRVETGKLETRQAELLHSPHSS